MKETAENNGDGQCHKSFRNFEYLESFRNYVKFFTDNIKYINKNPNIRKMGEILLFTIFSGSRIK